MSAPAARSVSLIERFRDRLPFAPEDPMVTLGEGSTPLVLAERLSERVGAEVHLKLEGLNPTGSFKDRGMTCAVSAALRDGAQAVICASTGNTAASAAAYAAKAGMRGVVIIPDGKIATGKLAQALMHGARVIALRGNFDKALELVRELAETPPDRARQLGQRVPPAGTEDGGVRAARGPRRTPRRALHPGRQRRQHHRLLAGLRRGRGGAAAVRLPGRGRRAAGLRRAGAPTRRRSPARSGSATRRAGRRRSTRCAASRGAIRAVTDDEILAAYRLLAATEGVFCEPASAASVAGLLKYGADGAERVACVLTGHGLKDPEVALEQVGAVVPCEPQLRAIERAVLG